MATKIETLELQILANSTSAKLGIDALTSSLKKLKTAASGGLGLPVVSKEVSGLGKALNQAKKASNKSAGSLTELFHGLTLGAGAFKKIGGAIWSTIEKSSDYTETLHLFDVAMGDTKYAYDGAMVSAKEYAEIVSDIMGIDTKEWMEAQGIFMTLATGFGVASGRAAVMSKNLTQLSYDLSSFYNMDVDQAFLKVKSGLAGELEPLRAIGYDLSQAKLEAVALEKGIDKAVSAMTQAEKAELRYYAIMTQVTDTHGDMAETLNQPANQLRVLKAEVNMAAREIGNLFIPALNAVLPYAISAAKVIGSLANSIAGVFGIKKDKSVEKATESVADGTASMAANLEESQKEAKKLKSYMLGIDELNVINPNTDSEEDGSSFTFPLEEYDFMEGLVESKVNGITEKMKEWLGISGEIKSLSDLLTTNFGNILVAVGLIGVGMVAWKIADIVTDVNKLTALMSGLSRSMSLLGIALKAMGVVAIIAAATAGAVWLVKNTDDTMTKIGAIVSAGFLAVGAILAFTGNIPLGIALMATGALAMGTAIAMNTTALSDEVKNIIGLITGIVAGALLAVGAILAFSGANIPIGIALMLGGALTFATAVAPNWNGLSDTVKGVISAIMAVVGAALLVLGIILLCTGAGTPLGIGLILAGVASMATPVALNWNFLVDMVKGIWDKVVAFWNAYIAPIFTKEWWSNLINKAMGGLKSAFTNALNWLVDKFNGLITKVNSLLGKSFDIPDFLGGGSFSLGIQIPLIPHFAEGGFPEQGQMFIAREAGAEMVGNIGRKTAVANNDQIVGGIASGVATANEEQNALLREQNSLLRAILEKDSGVYLDGKSLTNSVEKYQRERGRVIVTGGVL